MRGMDSGTSQLNEQSVILPRLALVSRSRTEADPGNDINQSFSLNNMKRSRQFHSRLSSLTPDVPAPVRMMREIRRAHIWKARSPTRKEAMQASAKQEGSPGALHNYVVTG